MSTIIHKTSVVARLTLGALFLVFGLNGFFDFLPPPSQPEVREGAEAFLAGLSAAGYMFPLIKGIEVLVGLALLSNRFVPLALTVLAPISINIFLFHAVLVPGLALPVVIVGLQTFLAWLHREAYRPLLRARAHSIHGVQGAEPAVMQTALQR